MVSDVAQVHEAQITSLQSDVDTLKASLESADEKKAELEAVVEKNEFLKNENYRLEEELIKLRGNHLMITFFLFSRSRRLIY